MKRIEEIRQAAHEYANSDAVTPEDRQVAYGDFINGAKWADKHPRTDIIERDSISFCRMLLISKFCDIAKKLVPQDVLVDEKSREIHDMIVNFDKACEFVGYKLNEDKGIFERLEV